MSQSLLHRLLLAFAMLCATLVSVEALADAPLNMVNYQGRLLESDGDVVPDGAHTMRFTVYDDSTGGASLWTETQSVTTSDGLFTTLLGKTAGFMEVCNPCKVWLQIEVMEGGLFKSLVPRQPLTPTPFALSAGGVTGESNPESPGTPVAIGSIKGWDGGIGSSERKYEIILSADTDGDGQYEYLNRSSSSTTAGAIDVMEADVDADGIADHTSSMECDATSARTGLVTRSGSTTATIRMASSGGGPITPSSDMLMDLDSDDDGIAESSSDLRIEPIGSSHTLSGHSGSTTGTIRIMAKPVMTADDHTVDSDNDGTADMSATTTVTTDSATLRLNGLPPGVPIEGNYTMTASGTGARGVLSGMSGSTTGTIRMEATPGTTHTTWYKDMDDDGYGDMTAETIVDSDSATLRLNGLPPGEPVIGTLSLSASGAGSRGVLSGMSGSTTGTIRLDATPAHSTFQCGLDDDNDGVAEKKLSIQIDDLVSHLSLEREGSQGITFEVDGTGPSLAVDTIPGSHPIVVGGGAYCNGTTWVNASDVNSKENFENVDGEKILEKIEQLPISQWNYKQDDESVKHIGPTAQDFKSTFGVGADDKSISTIDPSGIALAAIKQLIKENEDLRSRIAKLEDQQKKAK